MLAEGEEELRTLLLKDRDFRHLPILTVVLAKTTCQYIHDNSKNIDCHNNNDEDGNDNILVTKLTRNQCQKHDVRERENEYNTNDIHKSTSKHEKGKPKRIGNSRQRCIQKHYIHY